MTNDITAAVAARRESARTPAGQFGTQPAAEAGIGLDGDAPVRARTLALPDPRDEQTLREFVTAEVSRHRATFHDGNPAVRFDGGAIIEDLKRRPDGDQLSGAELEAVFERHQYLDPEDYERVESGRWGRLLGRRPYTVQKTEVEPSWP